MGKIHKLSVIEESQEQVNLLSLDHNIKQTNQIINNKLKVKKSIDKFASNKTNEESLISKNYQTVKINERDDVNVENTLINFAAEHPNLQKSINNYNDNNLKDYQTN